MADLKVEQGVGPWTLAELLGEGGNAEVWRCTDQHGNVRAVKFLKTKRVDSPRWERFRREVDYFLTHGNRPGILPVDKIYLPAKVPAGKRAWYSMPVATPMADALADAELREVVAAVAPIAETLSALWEEDETAHRDVKPGNLYQWQDEWAIGDFGLIWQPDLSTLTASNEITGPFTFTAPELFRSDLPNGKIDYSRVDVFSLAKTLWALARGQQFAVPGEHHTASDPIGEYRPSNNAGVLDEVLERATATDPQQRPSMRQFGDELRHWLELRPASAEHPDLSAVAAQIREQVEPAVARQSEREQLEGLGERAASKGRERLAPLFAQIGSLIPSAEVDVPDEQVESLLRSYDALGEPEVLFRESICARISNKEEPLAFVLHLGVLVEVLDSGEMRIGAAFLLGHEQVMQASTDQNGSRAVPAGTVETEAAMVEMTDWLIDRSAEWLQRFTEG